MKVSVLRTWAAKLVIASDCGSFSKRGFCDGFCWKDDGDAENRLDMGAAEYFVVDVRSCD